MYTTGLSDALNVMTASQHNDISGMLHGGNFCTISKVTRVEVRVLMMYIQPLFQYKLPCRTVKRSEHGATRP
jgi:hypothetical protein